MKNITDNSLSFSVITEETSVQTYYLYADQASLVQDLMHSSSSVYVFHQADDSALSAILHADRVGDDLIISAHQPAQWEGALRIEQFFSGNGDVYLARQGEEVVRIVAAKDYPQQGTVEFNVQPVTAAAELPQLPAMNMLSNALFAEEPVFAQPQVTETLSESAAQPVAPALMMASMPVSEPPKITNAIDDLGSRKGSLSSGSVTDDKKATLEGTGNAGSILNVLDNGVVIGQVQVDGSGHWRYEQEENMAESGHVFTVVDTASGESSAGFVLIVDSVAPSRAIIDSVINDLAGDVVVGTNQQTNDNTPVINGRGEAFSMIAIYNGKMLIGTSFADASGKWTFTSPFAFPDGDYTLTAKAMDFSGNVGLASSAYKITIDTIPPAVPVILTAEDNVGPLQGDLVNGDLTDDRTPTIKGKAEPGLTIFVFDDVKLLGTTTADASGDWSFTTPADLINGEHQFKAMARDPAGNLSTFSDNFTLQVGDDRTPAPTLGSVSDTTGSVQGLLYSGDVTDEAAPTLRGKAQAGAVIKIFDNGNLIGATVADINGDWQYKPDPALTEGHHSLQLQAQNGTNSPSLMTPAFELELDLTPPDASNLRITGVYDDIGDVQGNVAAGGRTDDRSPVVNGTGPAGETVVVYVTEADGQREVGRVRVGSDGHWSLQVSGMLSYGMSTFTAVAVDTAGNITEPSTGYSITVTTQDAVGGYDIGASQDSGTLINTTVVGNQNNPQVTKLVNGNLLVVWQQDVAKVNDGYDVVMQLMDPTGTHKIGTQQFVNQRNINNQDSPTVTALADGGFVIAWESYNTQPDNNADGVLARRYDANGAAQTDEFLVNQTTAGAQRMAASLGLPDGGYIISWYSDQNGGSTVQRIYDANNNPVGNEFVIAPATRSAGGSEMVLFEHGPSAGWYLTVWNGTDSNGNGVFGQMRKTDGTSAGPILTLNTTQDKNQNFPDAITLKDGSFVVFWDSNDSKATGTDIRAIHYTFDPITGMVGAKSTGDFIVNDFRAGNQYKPVGVALDDGGYMLIWGSDGGDGDGSAIYAQRFDANSNKVGHEFLVNPTTAGNQGSGWDNVDLANILDATLMDNGNVFITWHSDRIDTDGFGIEGVTVDIDASFYSEFQVNSTATNDQKASSTTSLPGGGFVVVWESSQTGSADVMAQIFDASGMPVGAEFRVNSKVAGVPDVITLTDGSFVVSYHSWEGGVDIVHTQHYGYTYDEKGNITGAIAVGDDQQISQAGQQINRNAVMTSLDDGGYMLVWQSKNGGSSEWQVYSAQYDAHGQQIPGSQMQVASVGYNGANSASKANVTALGEGLVGITYARNTTQGDVYFRIYDTKTQTYGEEVRANQTTTGTQGTPNVAKLANGNFVVTWDSNDNTGMDQSEWGAWGRIYSPQGEAVSNEFLMNSFTPKSQLQPTVIYRPGGGFVTLYLSQADIEPGGGTYGVYAQFFDDAGHRIGQEIRVHQLMKGDQWSPDGTFLDDGRLFVTWTDTGVGDGSGSAVKGRILDLDTSLGLEVTPDQSAASVTIETFSLTDNAAHGDLWMLFDDGSESGLLLSNESLTAVRGGSGDDVIGISSTTFSSINGGDGVDTLLLDGKNMSLDLDALVSQITGIEKIDLGQGNANSLSLSANALEGLGQQDLMVADGKNQFVVNGDGSNSLKLVDTQSESWTETGEAEVGGVVYHTWVSGANEVLVEQSIHVTVM